MARVPPVVSASGVRVDILGPLRLERDGEPVELSGGRLRALLTRLALDAGRPVTTSALVDAVWDNDLPVRRAACAAVARVAAAAQRRRRAGGHARRVPARGRAGRRRRGALRARWSPRVARARRWRSGAARRASQRSRSARLRALLALDDATLPELEAAVAEHPLNEKLAARHITALAAAGRQADALSAYEHVRIRLDEELGAAAVARAGRGAPRRAQGAGPAHEQPACAGDELRRPRGRVCSGSTTCSRPRGWSRWSARAAPARRGWPARRSHAGWTASTAACGWSSWRRSRPRSRSSPPRWPRSACARAPCSTARARRCATGWSG